MTSNETALSSWDGEAGHGHHDPATGAWFVVAIDSTLRGPGAGGTRAPVYPTPEHAVTDAVRLARAMTLKMAVADLPMGGGKSVIAVPATRQRLTEETWRRLLATHAANLERLAGDYWTGPDIGTGSADLQEVAERSGVDRGQIYQYFGDRRSLLRAAVAARASEWAAGAKRHWEKSFRRRRSRRRRQPWTGTSAPAPAGADAVAMHTFMVAAYKGYLIFREALARDLDLPVEQLHARVLAVHDQVPEAMAKG